MRPSLPAEQLTPALLARWPLPLDEDDDKYARGTVLVVGGSLRTPGAVMLSGLATLRVGAGRLQLATVEDHAPALGVGVPEALVEGLRSLTSGAIDPAGIDVLAPLVGGADAVLFGPGLEDPDATAALFRGLLPHLGPDAILVIDALGLVCLTDLVDATPDAVAKLRDRLVISPNLDEARTMLQADPETDESALAPALAERFGAVASVHGTIAAPDGRRWHNGRGGAGLGTSGSGDVLAGLAAGAAARTHDAAQAACWASYLHTAAGERLAGRIGEVGFLARELLDEVPVALGAVGRADAPADAAPRDG